MLLIVVKRNSSYPTPDLFPSLGIIPPENLVFFPFHPSCFVILYPIWTKFNQSSIWVYWSSPENPLHLNSCYCRLSFFLGSHIVFLFCVISAFGEEHITLHCFDLWEKTHAILNKVVFNSSIILTMTHIYIYNNYIILNIYIYNICIYYTHPHNPDIFHGKATILLKHQLWDSTFKQPHANPPLLG
jgi:hypothetical protein